jgi:hypothetical protein
MLHLLNVTLGQTDLGFEECFWLPLGACDGSTKAQSNYETADREKSAGHVIVPILWDGRANRLSKSKVFAGIEPATVEGGRTPTFPSVRAAEAICQPTHLHQA